MNKKSKKLRLHRETLHSLAYVTAGASAETICGYTCIRQCQLVPSVDGCGTNMIACASAPPGCNSGICDSQIINGCASAVPACQ
jgi:hypothetical protein